MSYDIEFLRFDPDKKTIEDVLRRRDEIIDLQKDDDNLFPPSDHEDQHRLALVNNLRQLHSSLKMVPGVRGFSQGCWIESTDSNFWFPYLDIGIGRGFMSFSYSAPASIFQTVFQIIAVFEKHGYFAWDPQTDSRVSSTDVLTQSRDRFEQTRGRVIDWIQSQGEELFSDQPEIEELLKEKEKKKDQAKLKKKKHKTKKK
jgi:hypothetical protein